MNYFIGLIILMILVSLYACCVTSRRTGRIYKNIRKNGGIKKTNGI